MQEPSLLREVLLRVLLLEVLAPLGPQVPLARRAPPLLLQPKVLEPPPALAPRLLQTPTLPKIGKAATAEPPTAIKF